MLLFRFAFVEFESTEDAKEALLNLNNTDIEGRTIRLEYSQNSNRADGGRGNSGWFSNSKRCSNILPNCLQESDIAGPDVMTT